MTARTALALLLLAAATPLAARDGAAACPRDPLDPFDPGATMPAGRHEGRCLDTRVRRSLHRLSPDEAAAFGLRVPPGAITVANVLHGGRYRIAILDPAAVEEAIFQIERFPAIVPAAHTQLRFRFAAGRGPLLVPQRRGDTSNPVRLPDLVFSVEAVHAPPDTVYDLTRGMQQRFGLAYRLVSLSDRYASMVVSQRHRVDQLRLALTPAERRSVLEGAIVLGDAAGLGRMYHTIGRNCTTEIYRVLDRAVEYGRAERLWAALAAPVAVLPTQAPLALRARGLLDGGSPRPDLETEHRERAAAR